MVWALCYLCERASGEINSGKRVGMENSGHEECVISALRVVTNEHQGRKPADTGGINSGYKGDSQRKRVAGWKTAAFRIVNERTSREVTSGH